MKRYDVTFYITAKCNMNCFFCLRSEDMVLQELPSQTRLDRLNDLISSNPYQSINFAGGEPLLDLVFLLQALTLAKEKDSNTEFIVYTNGSLISPEIVSIFNENKIRVIVSFNSVSGLKSVRNAIRLGGNLNLVGDINNIVDLELSTVIYPGKKFSQDIQELSDLFPHAGTRISLDDKSKWDDGHITYIESELQTLQHLQKLRIVNIRKYPCHGGCSEILSSGNELVCKSTETMACPTLAKRLVSQQALEHLLTIATTLTTFGKKP